MSYSEYWLVLFFIPISNFIFLFIDKEFFTLVIFELFSSIKIVRLQVRRKEELPLIFKVPELTFPCISSIGRSCQFSIVILANSSFKEILSIVFRKFLSLK